MLAIKFKKIGKKHQATFRLVVIPRRSKLNGRFVEDIGWYNPHSKKSEIDVARVKYWIGVGAQTTPTVHNLLVSQKIVEGKTKEKA